MNLKSLLLFFFVSFFLISISNIKAEEKIAFIDLNIIFDNSKAGKKIIKQVKKKQKENSSQLNKFKKKIENDREELKKQNHMKTK